MVDISDQRGSAITVEQAREILAELNLSEELLLQALQHIQQVQADKHQKRQNLLVFDMGSTKWSNP